MNKLSNSCRRLLSIVLAILLSIKIGQTTVAQVSATTGFTEGISPPSVSTPGSSAPLFLLGSRHLISTYAQGERLDGISMSAVHSSTSYGEDELFSYEGHVSSDLPGIVAIEAANAGLFISGPGLKLSPASGTYCSPANLFPDNTSENIKCFHQDYEATRVTLLAESNFQLEIEDNQKVYADLQGHFHGEENSSAFEIHCTDRTLAEKLYKQALKSRDIEHLAKKLRDLCYTISYKNNNHNSVFLAASFKKINDFSEQDNEDNKKILTTIMEGLRAQEHSNSKALDLRICLTQLPVQYNSPVKILLLADNDISKNEGKNETTASSNSNTATSAQPTEENAQPDADSTYDEINRIIASRIGNDIKADSAKDAVTKFLFPNSTDISTIQKGSASIIYKFTFNKNYSVALKIRSEKQITERKDAVFTTFESCFRLDGGEIIGLKIEPHQNLVRTYAVLLFDSIKCTYKIYNKEDQIPTSENEHLAVRAILLEYISHKDLLTNLQDSTISCGINLAFEVSIPLCDVLGHIEKEGYIYRDLKLENIICINNKKTNSLIVKLIDLGGVHKLKKHETIQSTFGTLRFMAPEIIEKKTYGHSSNLWSLGLIIYTLAIDLYLFNYTSDTDYYKKIHEYSNKNDEDKKKIMYDKHETHKQKKTNIDHLDKLFDIIIELHNRNPTARPSYKDTKSKLQAIKEKLNL